jgi:hypothetical protein
MGQELCVGVPVSVRNEPDEEEDHFLQLGP